MTDETGVYVLFSAWSRSRSCRSGREKMHLLAGTLVVGLLVLQLLSLTLRSIAGGNNSAFLRVDTIQREISDTERNFDLDKLHVFLIGPHCSVGIVDGWPGTI